jgi:hypothetical protein
MADDSPHSPLDKRQQQEDKRALLRLVATLLDPNARLDHNERATLAELLRDVLEDVA